MRTVGKYFREYYLKNREKILARNRKWMREHPLSTRPDAVKKRRKRSNKSYIQRLKRETLTHYGGGKLICVACGFSDVRALSIDHVNNDGYAHRKTLGAWSKTHGFYNWLKKQGFPEGYQTLCMNCQFIKKHRDIDIEDE